MAVGLRCPWHGSETRSARGPKTVNIFLGFFFVLNTAVGTGFLGVPYAFFYAGFPAAISTLLLLGFLGWNTANWVIEVMARAQAVELYQKSTKQQGDVATTLSTELSDLHNGALTHPQFQILPTRKFEPTELCEIFLHKWTKYLYLLMMVVSMFLAQWSFTTVAASAWASNIPINFGTLHQCGSDDFQHVILPHDESCLNAYRFCIFVFAVIVIPLSLMDLKEQLIVQVILGLLRYATMGALVVYSIVNLIQGGDVCSEGSVWTDLIHALNSSSNSTQFYELDHVENTTSHYHLRDLFFGFNWKGWVVAVPVFAYAVFMHQGIPALTHPIKQKKYLRWLMLGFFVSTVACYLILGITVSWWFRATIQETATLSFVEFSRSGHSPQLRALSYYLILFPSLDVASAFPLSVHILTNNVYSVFMGQDTSKKPKYRFDWVIRVVLKFFMAVLPIVGALFLSNLIYVLKYAGLIGFGICFFFPTALQLQSQRMCKKLFVMQMPQARRSSSNSTEETPLVSVQNGGGAADVKSLYMTPYSSRIFSHPIVVVILGAVQTILFLLAIVGIIAHPDKIECEA